MTHIPQVAPSLHPRKTWGSLLGVAFLACACSSVPPEPPFQAIVQATQAHAGLQAQWARHPDEQRLVAERVRQLLASPMQRDDAVQVALLNSPALQAAYFELGIAQAEVSQDLAWPNPGLSLGRLRRDGERESDLSLQFNLGRLLMQPWTREMGNRRLAQVRSEATLQTLSLVGAVRKAWVRAVASEEAVRYFQQVMDVAQASETLASRMAQAGNTSRLDLMREQVFYADAALNLAKARQMQHAEREQLIRLLGLWGEQTAFKLPARLPDLPAQIADQPEIEQTAMSQRLDLQAMRLQTEQLAQKLGLSRVSGMVNVLELGGVHNTFSGTGGSENGASISLEIPLFDWGQARGAKAEAQYQQSVRLLSQAAIDARSEVREAYLALRNSHDIAKHHRDVIVPLRQRISEENQLRYNGMLIGVFDLLADARAQMGAVNGHIEALRDFWLAQADLDMSLVGKPNKERTSRLSATPTDAPAGGH